MFTLARLKKSSDVFPIELLDIKECILILFREDAMKRLPVSHSRLRFQRDHEYKRKLIQLRERCLLVDGSEAEVTGLMIATLSTFQILI